ncbi:PaaI family thioesterase [Ectothiorhodospiraceae bacterium WFHF3C12]|nr:PaaI family thioesterase [Ectothiorhodospiraceae bacterium WFHF3C12]
MSRKPLSAAIDRKVRDSFNRQSFMQTLGASIVELGEGWCALVLDRREDLLQQHGYLHAGVVSTLADNACGYAALSTMPEDATVLTTEFKINLMAPAAGERIRAEGAVIKSGRTLSVVTAEVSALNDGAWKTIAVFQGSMMCLRHTADDHTR